MSQLRSNEVSRDIQLCLEKFTPIGLDELGAVQLLNRVDTKFLLHASQFEDILREVQPQYYALEIENKRVFDYCTLYFDTDEYDLYKLHHNGRLNRLKVRLRSYVDSGLCYFEVKSKIKGARTDKKRIPVADPDGDPGHREMALIDRDRVQRNRLKKKMAIVFSRITLANRNYSERLTFDVNLGFNNLRDVIQFPDLVVAEVKTEKRGGYSPIIDSFRRRGIKKTSFSKYAIAVAMMEDVKSNAFKRNLVQIDRIMTNARRDF